MVQEALCKYSHVMLNKGEGYINGTSETKGSSLASDAEKIIPPHLCFIIAIEKKRSSLSPLLSMMAGALSAS